MTAQDDTKEQESDVEFLTSMMGDAIPDPEIARRVLRKCDGDVQKAATAILEGDRGLPLPPNTRPSTPEMYSLRDPEYTPPTTGPGKNSPAIDLTGDDENNADGDYARALKASLEPNHFGPSQRAPDPNWAVVPSNVIAGPGVVSQDEQMDRAIQESLQGHYKDFADESYQPPPPDELLRQGNSPVALPPSKATLAHAALILQGLFFVPQVRLGVARFRPSGRLGENPQEDGFWTLSELFTNMDYGVLGQLCSDEALKVFGAREWTNPTDHPGVLSRGLYRHIAELVDRVIHHQFVLAGTLGPRPRLFHFLYGQSTPDPRISPDETSIVQVTIGGNATGDNNDLISCLAAQLSAPLDQPNRQQTIFEPSDVVAFELAGNSFRSSAKSGLGDGKVFKYPKHIYLDQFLQVNLALANSKRAQQHDMGEEMQKLVSRRKSLTSFNDKDTLKDLRSSLYYYENVADARGDLARQADINRTGSKLKNILTSIEKDIEAIDNRISQLKAESAALFDTPDLQKLRYDLRVVFFHDGIVGRKHLYSYVEDNGKWWKTVDNIVTEVPEQTVLTDQTGLHLASGPYLLLYSKALLAEYELQLEHLPWPDKLKDATKHNNKIFLSNIKPELASQVYDFNSPPTSPTAQSVPFPPIITNQSQEPMDLS